MKLNWIDPGLTLELCETLEIDKDYLHTIFENNLHDCRQALLDLQEGPIPWSHIVIDDKQTRLRFYLTNQGRVSVVIEKSPEQKFEEQFKDLLGEVYNEMLEESYHHRKLEQDLKKDGLYDKEIDIVDQIIQEW